jgi:hypothetical protein
VTDAAAQLLELLRSECPAQRVGAAIGMAKTVAEDAGLSRQEFVRLCGALWDHIDRMVETNEAGAN